jgi:hypothetical protein
MNFPIKEIECWRLIMDIVIGGTSSVTNDSTKNDAVVPAGGRAFQKDRRKNKRDRRKSVRDGIIVSLSVKDERRFLRDRRRNAF